jgi:hypothetical protein
VVILVAHRKWQKRCFKYCWVIVDGEVYFFSADALPLSPKI